MEKVKLCGVTTETTAMKYFFLFQMKYLKENGFDVDIACNMDKEFYEINSQYFNCVNIPASRGVDFIGMFRSILILYKHFKMNKYNIIQYTTPNAALYASVAGFLARVPIRYYCQWGIRYQGFSGLKLFVFKSLEHITCLLSTHITLDSPGNLEINIKDGNFRRSKASVIYNGSVNGVDLDEYDISRKKEYCQKIRHKYDILENEFVIGYMGRLMLDKGANELLYAAKKFVEKYNNAKFIIVGPIHSYEGLDKSLLNWAQNNKNIILTGSKDNVNEYLASFDLFVFPSYREGYGGGVIQAATYEIPAVVSDIPALVDSVDGGKCGIITKVKDGEDLFRGIEEMFLNDEMREQMGKYARKRVINDFDRKKWMGKYIEYVNSLTLKI